MLRTSHRPMPRRAAALVPLIGLVLVAACSDLPVTPDLDPAKGGEKGPTKFPFAAVVVTPDAGTIQVGETIQLTAVTVDKRGKVVEGPPITWVSASPSVATVSTSGLVTGVSVGTAVIQAEADGKTGSATITVIPPPVASVEVAPSAASLAIGGTVALTATLRDANGNVLTGRVVAWSTTDPAIATVSATGVVSAHSAGDAVITAESEGKTGTSDIRAIGWRRLATAPIQTWSAVSSTFDPQGQAVFAYLGIDFRAGSPEIWRFDLRSGAWSMIPASGHPSGKYRQVRYDPAGGGRFLTYWDGLGQVYGLSATGGAWAQLLAGSNSDHYYEGSSFIDPNTGRLSLLMGYGFGMHKNTLWQFNGSAWELRPTTGTPSARMQPRLAIDQAGQRLFAVSGHVSASYSPTDVWELDLGTMSWRVVRPDGQGPPAKFSFAGYVPSLNRVYVYGGMLVSNGVQTDVSTGRMWYVDVQSNQLVELQTAGSTPGARWSALGSELHYDAGPHRLLLVGGLANHTANWDMDIWAYYLPR